MLFSLPPLPISSVGDTVSSSLSPSSPLVSPCRSLRLLFLSSLSVVSSPVGVLEWFQWLFPCTNPSVLLNGFGKSPFISPVISSDHPRSLTDAIAHSGAVVSGYQWAITIGLLIAAVINNATKDKASHAAWRLPIAIQFIWGFILAVGMILLPESPRWLIKKGRDADAAGALSRLISLPPDHPELQAELDQIRLSFQQEMEIGESSYADCFRSGHNKIRLRTLTGIFIQAWQQLTGINFIFYYGTVFFKNSGISDPFLITIATNIINVFMTLPGMWGVERFGRRRLLLVGAAGMCICEFLVAIVGVTVSTTNLAGQKVLIAFVCIYIAFFASTWGPVAWVITGEVFPLNIRAKAMSLSVASNWLWNFGIGYATPYLVNKQAGSAGLEVKVFFIWGSTCAGCLLFTYFCVPEVSLCLSAFCICREAHVRLLDQGIVARAD